MPVEHAARIEDEIAHGFGLAAMVAGAVVGVLAGAAVVAATAATGGLAAVVIAGAVAGGGLAGGQIMSGLTTIFDLPEPTSGVLAIGSPNVSVNKRAAIRAELSSASSCSGLPFNHPWWPASVTVQEGSATVRINGRPASRLKSKLMCGAHIKTASPDVRIGGETERTGFVFDLEAWTKTGLEILGLAALVGAGVLAVAAGVAATAAFVGVGAAGFTGMEGVGRIGDALGPGYRDLLQGVVGMGLVVASPKLSRLGTEAQAARSKPPAVSSTGPTPSQQAQAWQGKGAYPGVDRYRDITLKKGTIVYAGDPGQSSYHMPASAVRRANGSRSQLFQGLQVEPHPQFGYRPAVRAYEVTQDTPAAFGITRANPQHGAGGLPQIFVPDYSTFKPLSTTPLGP